MYDGPFYFDYGASSMNQNQDVVDINKIFDGAREVTNGMRETVRNVKSIFDEFEPTPTAGPIPAYSQPTYGPFGGTYAQQRPVEPYTQSYQSNASARITAQNIPYGWGDGTNGYMYNNAGPSGVVQYLGFWNPGYGSSGGMY